ncbi:MAG: hypothetical protein PHW04_09190 [Candidatus Wallbacteria bacterium]|nr:hypothetical protein [Candidatus Wallbacteria bacterium]
MKIKINHELFHSSRTGNSAIIREIEKFLQNRDLLIEQITVGPDTYFQLELVDFEKAGEKTVEITAITPVKFCLSMATDAIDYINKLILALNKTKEFFRTESPDEGSQILFSSIPGLEWINNVIIKIEPVLGLDYNKLEVNSEKVTDYFLKYSGKLNQIVEAFEEKDYFLTADLLEYELIPALLVWKDFFIRVITHNNAG